MPGFTVQPEALHAARTLVEDARENASAGLARVNAAADDLLGGGWNGGAAAAFAGGFADWRAGAETVLAALGDIGAALGRTAACYADAEAVAIRSAVQLGAA
jgi:WXG100 family type VII secretion target